MKVACLTIVVLALLMGYTAAKRPKTKYQKAEKRYEECICKHFGDEEAAKPTAKPTAARATTARPVTARAATDRPATAKAADVRPTTAKAATARPTTEKAKAIRDAKESAKKAETKCEKAMKKELNANTLPDELKQAMGKVNAAIEKTVSDDAGCNKCDVVKDLKATLASIQSVVDGLLKNCKD